MTTGSTRLLLALAGVFLASALSAQVADVPYGAPIPLAEAKRALAAARVEAIKNKWNVAITIADNGGHLVAFERMDTTQTGSIEISLEKARTAAAFRRPTKMFQDTVAAGG